MKCGEIKKDIPACYLLPNMKEVRLSFNFHYGSKERFRALCDKIQENPERKVTYFKWPNQLKGKFLIE